MTARERLIDKLADQMDRDHATVFVDDVIAEAMATAERYDFVTGYDTGPGMEPSADGEWIRYADVAKPSGAAAG